MNQFKSVTASVVFSLSQQYQIKDMYIRALYCFLVTYDIKHCQTASYALYMLYIYIYIPVTKLVTSSA